MRRILAGATAAVAMMVSCHTMPSIQSPQPIATDVCELSKNSEAFDGKAVRLHATVLSDLIERTFMVSADCPSETVSIAMAGDAEGGESLKRAMIDVMPDGTVTATFIGTFEWHANETPARVLNVRAVHDLAVKKSASPLQPPTRRKGDMSGYRSPDPASQGENQDQVLVAG